MKTLIVKFVIASQKFLILITLHDQLKMEITNATRVYVVFL